MNEEKLKNMSDESLIDLVCETLLGLKVPIPNFNPFIDPNDMWHLVRKVNEKGYDVSIRAKSNGFYWVDICGSGDYGEEVYYGYDRSMNPGRALCIAIAKIFLVMDEDR